MTFVSRSTNKGFNWSAAIGALILTNVLVFQITWNLRGNGGGDERYELLALTSSTSATSVDFILSPPGGKAVALPSVRIPKTTFKSDKIYGGVGDKPHLGGFTDLDHHGVSPAAWKWMVTEVGVHSLLDVGCGRGISTSWFYFHGVDVQCVEGSHDAIENTVMPDPSRIVEHDFSRGPWWPDKTYDAVWCVEFLEHVGRNFQKNYLTAFRKSALIFATHSNWGGHHHVEVHNDEYWREKFTMFGFIYSPALTKKIRSIASSEQFTDVAPNGIKLNAQHVWLTMNVFINPAVAALPQHAHLLSEPGCYWKSDNGVRVNRECGTGDDKGVELETVLPESFRALKLTSSQDKEWFEHIKPKVKPKKPDEERILLGYVTKEEVEEMERKLEQTGLMATTK